MNFPPLKTYSHLEPLKKIPSDYEIASSDLLYYLRRGLEVETPVAGWYKIYQESSPLTCSDWNRFSDPRATTYAGYTSLQNKKEVFVEKLFESMADSNESSSALAWRNEVARASGCFRFLFHGLQMVAAYAGHMAPSSKIAIAFSFQAADEMRRVHHFSYQLALLEGAQAAESAKNIWMSDPAWQPLRKLLEELLVAYDWGEAYAALNLAVKPKIDILLEGFMSCATLNGRYKLAEIVGSMLEDSVWHRQWSNALSKMLIQDAPESEIVLNKWTHDWETRAANAVKPILQQWNETKGAI